MTLNEDRNKRKKLGLCQDCGDRAKKNRTRCSYCTYMHNERGRKHRQKQREIILTQYGGKCFCCGETNPKFLTLDHINNDGAKHRRELGSNKTWWWAWRNGCPNNLQLACFNCNCGRARNKGICPHEEEKCRL